MKYLNDKHEGKYQIALLEYWSGKQSKEYKCVYAKRNSANTINQFNEPKHAIS